MRQLSPSIDAALDTRADRITEARALVMTLQRKVAALANSNLPSAHKARSDLYRERHKLLALEINRT